MPLPKGRLTEERLLLGFCLFERTLRPLAANRFTSGSTDCRSQHDSCIGRSRDSTDSGHVLRPHKRRMHDVVVTRRIRQFRDAI